MVGLRRVSNDTAAPQPVRTSFAPPPDAIDGGAPTLGDHTVRPVGLGLPIELNGDIRTDGVADRAKGEVTGPVLEKAGRLYAGHDHQHAHGQADSTAADRKNYPHTKGKNFYDTSSGDASVEDGMDADKTLKSNGLTFKAEGKVSKSEEKALKGAVAALGVTNGMAGYESDVKLEIDGKTRYATIRIDDAGNATATLFPPSKTSAKALTGKQEVEAQKQWADKLKKDFGVTITSSGNREFSSRELCDMYNAFKLMGTEEKKALKGVTIERTDQIQSNGKVANASGLYVPDVSSSGENKTKIYIDDDAIAGNKHKFVGDDKKQWLKSTGVVMHEVGHAVADRPRLEAQMRLNSARDSYDASKGAYSKESRKIDINGPYSVSKPDEVKVFEKEANKLQSLIDQRDGAPVKDRAKLDEKIDAQQKKRNEAFSKMDQTGQTHFQKQKNLQDAHIRNIPGLEKAEAHYEKNKAHSPSAREKAFNEFVDNPKGVASPKKSDKILPFTDYAAQSHAKGDRGEFYAEAYSLYKLDRQFMEKNYPDLVKWFDEQFKEPTPAVTK